MNPEIPSIDLPTSSSPIMGINMDPTHLLWSTALTLILSHIGANYLKDITPRGYMFWFTILNIIFGFMFL